MPNDVLVAKITYDEVIGIRFTEARKF